VLSHTRNRGKGAVVRDGTFAARGDTIVFMDADLATDLGDLAGLRRALEFCDVVIGSRSMAASVVEARDYRAHMGRVFNGFTRGVSGLPYRDTQCGFKAFHAPAAKLLFALSGLNGYAFDVEILLFAHRLGLRVEEIPVHWTHVGGSHIRPFSDPARMTTDVIAAKMAQRQKDSVAVVTVEGGGDADRMREVQKCVRANDVVVRDDDAVHVVLGHLCPVALRHVIAGRLSRALDGRVNPERVSAARLIELVQRRPRLSIAPSIEDAPAFASAVAGS
jgi:hypothetical protein